MKKLEVTAAIIYANGKYLIAQRPLDKSMGGLWEFPGGKVDEGESLESCLIREIQEELELVISINKHFLSVNHYEENVSLNLHSYLCSIIDGEIRLNEHIDYKWITKNEFSLFDFPQADRPIIKKLEEHPN
ncbi:MAG: hypothetical protein A2X41_01445 [Candidatus Margulisbacteria bacterium GWE2_39_32]|nr:MAG: hypothetical protein A2X41_01445 [Candidatus Margulisbacteria bacterium GWE2_39_32]